VGSEAIGRPLPRRLPDPPVGPGDDLNHALERVRNEFESLQARWEVFQTMPGEEEGSEGRRTS